MSARRAARYNAIVLRVWCLAALTCLTLVGVLGTSGDSVNATPGSPDGVSVLADAPSTDGPGHRRWAVVRPAACPAGSSWTSQTHHAVLAHTLCHSMAGAPRSNDAAAATPPRALRLQFRTPLLI